MRSSPQHGRERSKWSNVPRSPRWPRSAQKVVNDAEDRARQLKLETEDWCDQRLGGIEGLLQKSLHAVAAGRARMQGTSRTRPAADPPPTEDPEDFFDQDAG